MMLMGGGLYIRSLKTPFYFLDLKDNHLQYYKGNTSSNKYTRLYILSPSNLSDGNPITRLQPQRGALIVDHCVFSSAGSGPMQKPYLS